MHAGLGASLEGVAEFVHWRYPHVQLREVQPTSSNSSTGLQRPLGSGATPQAGLAALQGKLGLSIASEDEPLPEGTCYSDDLLQVGAPVQARACSCSGSVVRDGISVVHSLHQDGLVCLTWAGLQQEVEPTSVPERLCPRLQREAASTSAA